MNKFLCEGCRNAKFNSLNISKFTVFESDKLLIIPLMNIHIKKNLSTKTESIKKLILNSIIFKEISEDIPISMHQYQRNDSILLVSVVTFHPTETKINFRSLIYTSFCTRYLKINISFLQLQ